MHFIQEATTVFETSASPPHSWLTEQPQQPLHSPAVTSDTQKWKTTVTFTEMEGQLILFFLHCHIQPPSWKNLCTFLRV